MVGLPDRPPAGWSFSYLDHVGGYLGAVAILTGLLHRRRTGEGQHLDVSQLEPATALSGALLLDALLNGRPARRPGFPTGNRRTHPPTAPGGAYRAAGDDNWIVISCRTEAQWEALVAVMGRPAWTDDPRFATLAGRVEHADALDALLESWTSDTGPLRDHGPPPGGRGSGRGRPGRGRPARTRSAAGGPGPLHAPRRTPRWDRCRSKGCPSACRPPRRKTGGLIDRGPPLLGEDTEAVLGELLGMTAGRGRRQLADGRCSARDGRRRCRPRRRRGRSTGSGCSSSPTSRPTTAAGCWPAWEPTW